VIADEPTASLDQKTGLAAISLMRRQNREQGTTFVFSTHDPKVLAEADRVVQLSDGRIVQ
jgi:putative ABC transport system ATP-binding protein